MQEKSIETPISVLVTVFWGTYALAATRVGRGEAFALGEGGFLPVPAAVLGGERFEFVRVGATGRVLLGLPHELEGRVSTACDEQTLASFVAAWALENGYTRRPREVELPMGARVELALVGSLFTLRVEVGCEENPCPREITRRGHPLAFAMTALSLALHGALIGFVVFTRQGLDADDAEGPSRDHVLFMRAMLAASAERERERPPSASTGPAQGGGTSSAAHAPMAPPGRAGASSSPTRGRMASAGPVDNPDPHTPAERLIDAASRFGMIGLLQVEGGAAMAAPSPFDGRIAASGRDPATASGSLFDSELSDRVGIDGHGPSGQEGGGGGDGDFVGLDKVHGLDVGTGGTPNGRPGGPGIGGPDGAAGGRPRKGIRMRRAELETNGRLPADTIQRTVRQQFGRFRICYENGLTKNPNLAGRVAVRFIIDRTGSVTMAQDGGSELADADVVACVARVFLNLSFPPPPDGVVTVTYPIVFSPGD